MNREEVGKAIMSLPDKHILAELPTGFGKTKIALDLLASRDSDFKHILIVIPRLVLIGNWKEEFIKWGYEHLLQKVSFITYMSFPKVIWGKWDFIIFDEAHHLSERCRNHIREIEIANSILLSATVKREIKYELTSLFKDLYIYRVSIKQAIQENILPDPKVLLLPLHLDTTTSNCSIIKNPKQKQEIIIPFSQRFNYSKVKNKRIVIKCTQMQYYNDLTSLIEWYRKKSYNEIFKNLFLRKSGDRIKWLSQQKTTIIHTLLDQLKDQRTLTFCNSIAQTEELGKYCINSKNKDSEENLKQFNTEKIKHITACNMLDEGINLTDCRIGIYAVLNSSERMIKQKLGRLLRHHDPIIILPYYVGTRDEEIVRKMIEDYNPELIKTVHNINNLKTYLQ